MSEYNPYRWGIEERTLHFQGKVDIEIGHADESTWGRVLIKCDGVPVVEMECTDPASIMWKLIK